MTAYRERTNAEVIQAIRDEDKCLGEHAMLSARIIHNNVVVMQAAYLEAKAGKGDDVAVAWIENLLIDSDNVPEEEYGGAGDLQNAHDPDLYFRDNHLDGELSPYQSRMAPLIDELARQLESVTAERDRLRAERQELERQEPIKYLYRVINCFGNDVLRDDPKGETIIETIPLYASPVPAAPAVPNLVESHQIEAPTVPKGFVAYLTQLADDPCQCHCCREKRQKFRAMLQSAAPSTEPKP